MNNGKLFCKRLGSDEDPLLIASDLKTPRALCQTQDGILFNDDLHSFAMTCTLSGTVYYSGKYEDRKLLIPMNILKGCDTW